MKKVLCFFSAAIMAISLIGCEKDPEFAPDSFGAISAGMIGDYELVDIHWCGLSVDLNGDGTGYWDLLYEYQNMIGYWEPNHIANVEKAKTISEKYGKPAIAVNVLLPYPNYCKTDDGYVVNGLKYFPLSIRLEDLKQPYNHVIQTKYEDASDPLLSSIDQILISEFADGIFKVGVHCTMIHEDASGKQEENSNYLYYKYRKLN